MSFNPFSKFATKTTKTTPADPAATATATATATERKPDAAPTPVNAGDAGGATEMTSDKSYKKMGEDGGGHVEHDALAAVDTAVSVREGKVYRTYRRRWFGLVQLILLNIIVSWDWLTFAPVAESAAKYYRVSQTDINWLSTAFMLAFPAIAPLTIKILNLGPKPSIMTSAGLVLAGNWVRYAGSHKFTPDGGNFGVVMFGQILTGLAQPFVLAAPTRYSDMWFTTRGRVAATAVTSLANPLGAALGQLIVPELVPGGKSEQVSRMVLYVAIISSVASIPSFFIPAAPPTPVAASSEHPRPSLRDSLRQVSCSLELWLILGVFATYVGLFNNISTVLVQMTKPHGFTEEEAGIGGAVLILVGLAAAAVSSPILDRKKTFVLAVKLVVPFNGLMYLLFIWMPEYGGVPGAYVVLALIGAAGFSLVPCALELLTELSYPVSPEVASTIAWAGGQCLGAIFIIISGALTAGKDADPPENLDRALIFQGVIALVAVPLPIMLGMFGREEKVRLRRVKSDEEGMRLAAVAA